MSVIRLVYDLKLMGCHQPWLGYVLFQLAYIQALLGLVRMIGLAWSYWGKRRDTHFY